MNMHQRFVSAFVVIGMTLVVALPAAAQTPRKDVIWARVASGPITLNGVLNEPSWAQAESTIVRFQQENGIPGSGWKFEQGVAPSDPSYATLKFLTVGNQIYLGAIVRDKSVGGSEAFNRFDGLLMAIKDHLDANFPKPPSEYLYSWWFPGTTDPQPVDQAPAFKGRWAADPPGSPRTPEQIANWDAVTVVNGHSNSDAVNDVGYTVEMRFNLTPMGYDVTQTNGDVVEWNISIYDCDWNWPNGAFFSANRNWWQSPWGNAMWYNEVRVYSKPTVTVSSGPVPTIGPDLVIHEITSPTPTIDGQLNESIWSVPSPFLYKFDIKYGASTAANTTRAGYPATGPYRSGFFQPTVNGGQAAVLNPGDATVKIFLQGDYLYFGFDVRDNSVQYVANFDRWDGFLITIGDYSKQAADHNVATERFSFQVGANGAAIPADALTHLVQVDSARVAIALKAGTTVDTFGTSADQGYTAEMRVNLRALGYPAGLGDGRLWLGVMLLDGDSYTPSSLSYGTRAWWFRQYEGECCPAVAILQKQAPTGIEPTLPGPREDYRLLGSFPNPSSRQHIQYALKEASRVGLEVYDVAGRLIEQRDLGLQEAGIGDAFFDGKGRSQGIYFYRLKISDPETGAKRAVLQGRMLLLQ
jgi:hypothetical protein